MRDLQGDIDSNENPFESPEEHTELNIPRASEESSFIPQPSLLWSMGLFIAFFIGQFILSFIFAIFLGLFLATIQGGGLNQKQLLKQVSEYELVMGSVASFLSCLTLSFAFHRSKWLNANGFVRFGSSQLLCLILLFPAMVLSCSEAAVRIGQYLPSFEAFDQMHLRIIELPLIIAIFVVAVLPAVGEELLFRGVIGRGLVARWGVIPGVLLTSLLFGIAHLNPPSIVGTFFLGAVFHYAYLKTKSIYAPMLLHFLNNSFAVISMHYPELTDPISIVFKDVSHVKNSVFIASTLALIGLLYLLKNLNTTWHTESGQEIQLGYPTAEIPPGTDAVSRNVPTPGVIPLLLGLLGAAGMFVVITSYYL